MAERQSYTWKNHRLTYLIHPSLNPKSKEKIVLVGGWCSVAGYWDLNIPFFQKFGDVIELDLVGHYPAEILNQKKDLSLQDFLDAQAKAIWAAAGEENITLVGHSTGGMAILAIAALFPERIKQVVSIAPYVHGPVPGILKIGVLGLRSNLGAIFDLGFRFGRSLPKSLQLGFSYGVYNSSKFHERKDIQDFLFRYNQNFVSLNPRNMLMILEMLDRTDLRPLVFGNKVPVLMLRGEEDPVIPGKQIQELERSTPNVKVVLFSQCGHFVHMEKKEAFERVVENFFLSKKKPIKKKGFF